MHCKSSSRVGRNLGESLTNKCVAQCENISQEGKKGEQGPFGNLLHRGKSLVKERGERLSRVHFWNRGIRTGTGTCPRYLGSGSGRAKGLFFNGP